MKVEFSEVLKVLIYLGSGALACTIPFLLPIESGAGRVTLGFFLFWGFLYLFGRLLKLRE